ncbi:methyltransferase type 11 [Rhizobium sp. CRIBSB]|nr:methyltransferase type 11 [Rhizobium sp. CRIBSB]
MRIAILTLCVLSTLTAACDGDGMRISSTRRSDDGEGKGVLKVVDALQCPQAMGVLTRKGSALNGGTTCTYVGPRGSEVSLHLIRLEGSVDAVLKTYEDQLGRDLPAAAQATDLPKPVTPPPPPPPAGSGDHAEVRLPGLEVDARGDKANVRIGPISIHADDTNATVDVSGDGETVNIQAHDDGAEIRTRTEGAATRTSWILTDSRGSAAGWRVVGYEARGPEGGPIVLATVRTKDRDEDSIFDAARDLVTLNVGE